MESTGNKSPHDFDIRNRPGNITALSSLRRHTVDTLQHTDRCQARPGRHLLAPGATAALQLLAPTQAHFVARASESVPKFAHPVQGLRTQDLEL
mmetsp:Transcript_102129/g.197712  ORF Transcript_102129/g.197712 Transcript_102129/m.197712 type:complete len:94 (+) Transcript_102129:442-723(+)